MIIKKILLDVKNGTSHSVDFLLEKDVKKTISNYGIRVRKIFAPLLRVAYMTQTKYKLKVDSREKLLKSAKGRIFAVNHRQGDDIVLGANVIAQSGYFVFGNKYLALETSNGLGLWAYGMILLDRDNINSRKATYEKMKYIIEHGGNIIIYPEGYWNLSDDGQKDERHYADGHNSENWLIQDLNIGIFRLAQETQCEIVPTILHYDEKKGRCCYGMRGMPTKVKPHENIFDCKNEFLATMNSMYYYLMEKYSLYHRKSIESADNSLRQQWEHLKKQLIEDCDIKSINYHLDLNDEKRIGKAKVIKGVCPYEEAFAPIRALNVWGNYIEKKEEN